MSNNSSDLNNNNNQPIAVVGMSSIFANARTLDEYWNNIIDKVDGITDVPADRWLIDDYFDADPTAADKTYCKRGGFIPEIDFDPMEFGLPPNILEVTDVAQMLTLIVAREVLKDAGVLDNPNIDRDRIGVTLGIGGGQKLIGPLVARLQYPILDRVLKSSGVEKDDRDIIIEKFKKAYIGWEENSFPGLLGNVISGRVANRFDLGGMNCVVDAACAASLAAMKMAIRELQTGASDMMLSGGICCDNSVFMYMSFSKTPAFTPTGIIQPFDHKSQGMLVGEGLGMVALKRLEDAERDGDRIYAVVKGVGSSSDGKYKSIYAPRSSGQAKALQRAYDEAGFHPSTVGLIEAHGTGTVAGDAAEFGGLRSVFEHENERKNHIALGSVKSQIGHTKSAAGVAGFIKVASALYHKVLPPTINISEPNPALNIADSAFYLNTESRPWVQDGETPRRAGVSAFGFGGTNFHFALEEYQPRVDGKYRRQRVAHGLVISAADRITLQQLCQSELGQLREQGVLHFESFIKTYAIRNVPNEHARFGLVAQDLDQAIESLEKAVAKLEMDEQTWQTPSGLFYRSTAVEATSVAGLFSGQGSQYVNMGKDIAMNFPPLLNVMSSMNALFRADDAEHDFAQVLYPNPVFNKDAEKALTQRLQLTQYAQPAIGSMSLGLYKIFKRAGLNVSCVAGHSFGELTAYCAAGVISEADYLLLAKTRGQSMAAPQEEGFDAGTMIAVVGDSLRVEDVIKDISGVQIANFNSGNQVVVAGETPAVAVAKEALKSADLRVIDLPVSAAFHTPLVSHAYKPFANAIDKVAFNAPQIPVYSNTTGVVHPSDVDALKNQLKDHVLNSVQFKSEIEAMYEAGARVFVEFGPKNVLTKLTQEILKEKPHHCVALNASPKKNSDVQLRSAAVELAVLGVLSYDIDTYEVAREKLADKVVPKMSVTLTGANYVSPKTAKIYEEALNDGHQIKQAIGSPSVAHNAPAPVSHVAPVASTVDAPVLAPAAAPIAAAAAAAAAVAVATKNVSAPAPSSPVTSQAAMSVSSLTPQMLSVVADKTGYPEDMLDLSMDMEADLGIDSIKRVEILGAMQDHVGDLPDLDPDELSELRTLQEVVDYLEGKLSGGVAVAAPQTAPVAPVMAAVSASVASNTASVSDLTPQMLSVVADKTGYPEDMLELSMDMEADLGIDSIKRVEILGAMQDHVGDLPDLDPDELSELRTLQEVVDYLESKLSGGVALAAPQAAPAVAVQTAAPAVSAAPVAPIMAAAAAVSAAVATKTASASVSDLTPQMLSVVADKTGYPEDMLELSMDMEADLGIDSIKRVEILGAMQDHVGDLPDLDPDELSELRTLQEVVDYLEGKLSGGVALSPPQAAPAVAVQTAAPAVSAAPVAPIMAAAAAVSAAVATKTASATVSDLTPQMLSVVADKTGYPEDMLELSMDMEADLGIDSIKRVEILGAMQDHVGDLPDLDPDELSELRTLQEVVDYLEGKLSGGVALAAPQAAPAVAVQTAAPAVSAAPVAPIMAAAAAVSAAVATKTASATVSDLTPQMLSVVADKTGYPEDMLELSMDMEADLGIDSIKRVEILGAMQDHVGDLPDLDPDELSELRTLQEVVDYLEGKLSGGVALAAPQAAPAVAVQTAAPAVSAAPVAPVMAAAAAVASNTASVSDLTPQMLSVVADKTGYPEDMLELSMDMEADLGIDSIKRVEILGAMQDHVGDLPDLDPDELSELRTLQEVVDYLEGKLSGGVALAAPQAEPVVTQTAAPAVSAAPVAPVMVAAAAVASNTASVSDLTPQMLSVVADKTGYPEDMLELSMDMEADLGIDSIKRVEILGAMQDHVGDLPDLDPDELSELRTLQEVVDYLEGKLSGGVALAAPQAAPAVAVQTAAPAVSAAPVAPIMAAAAAVSAAVATKTASATVSDLTPQMLSVVADKTGYPEDMLELSMDMEADLGIDSIKRVEILGAMQDHVGDLPDLDPDELSELRTLQEVVDYLEGKLSGGVALAAPKAASVVPAVSAGTALTPNAPEPISEHAPSSFVEMVTLTPPVLRQIDDLQSYVLVVDEGTEFTQRCVEKLIQQQLKVILLKLPADLVSSNNQFDGVQVAPLVSCSEQDVKACLDNIGMVSPIQALVFLQPNLMNVSQADRLRYVTASFMLLKHINPALMSAVHQSKHASLITVSRLDGALGYGASVLPDVSQSALFGLTKTAKHEWNQIYCRAVDIAPSINAATAADYVIAELFDQQQTLAEVGYSSMGRVMLDRRERDSYQLPIGTTVTADSVFLVSGGAKGVTKSCVLRLAKQHMCCFILLGRSELVAEPDWAKGITDDASLKRAAMDNLILRGEKPTPMIVNRAVNNVLSSREINATLSDIKACGARATYVSVDVTDKDALASSIAPSVQSFGQVTGIIHGAGVLADKLIVQKKPDEIERVYNTKVTGLFSMLACVDANALTHLALFSSAAGFYGNVGQSDYSAANETLNKFALNFKRSHPSCHVLSFNWGPWDGGMVTDSLRQMFSERGVYVIPVDAGAQLFVNELVASTNERVQILVGTGIVHSDKGEPAVKKLS